MSIRLAPSLALPDDAVTQTFGILAKRAAFDAIQAQRMISRPWRPDPPRYTAKRLAMESRWMRCPHTRGFHERFEEFVVGVEWCPDCAMPRWGGSVTDGVYTFIRVIDDRLPDGSYGWMMQVINVPVRAEGRQRVRGSA